MIDIIYMIGFIFCMLPEMGGDGHDFGHGTRTRTQDFSFGHKFGRGLPGEFLTSDSDSDADIDSDKVMTSNTDTTSDTGMSENLGHGHTSDTCARSSPHVTYK